MCYPWPHLIYVACFDQTSRMQLYREFARLYCRCNTTSPTQLTQRHHYYHQTMGRVRVISVVQCSAQATSIMHAMCMQSIASKVSGVVQTWICALGLWTGLPSHPCRPTADLLDTCHHRRDGTGALKDSERAQRFVWSYVQTPDGLIPSRLVGYC